MTEFDVLQRHEGIALATDPADYRVLNYGGGVQSTALLHMAMRGEFPDGSPFPRVDLVIHADTGDELPETVEHVGRQVRAAAAAGLDVAVVSAGNIYDDTLAKCRDDESRLASMPLHTHSQAGDPIIMRRQCTSEYKLKPMRKEIRRRLGYRPRQRVKHTVHNLLGITLDEAQRINGSRDKWAWLVYPLCEHGMTRADVVSYLRAIGEPVPPKSSCVVCPFHRADYWAWLKRERPDHFERAVLLDEEARASERFWDRPVYLHQARVPLADIPDAPIQLDLLADAVGENAPCGHGCFL